MSEEHLELTAEIVAAYVSKNPVRAGDFPRLIESVYVALSNLNAPDQPLVEEPKARLTAGQIRKSVTREMLISFEDGKPYKTLRRHLKARGLTPEAYREKWGLPNDYPIVAPAYSERRSAYALSLGLGLKHRQFTAKSAQTTSAQTN